MEPWVVGVDLGATKVALGLIDPENRIVARRRFAMAETPTADAVVSRVARSIDELAAEAPPGTRIAGLALCSPGPLDHLNGVILDPPNLPCLRNVPLAAMLQERLGMPVRLEHDAKAAALGEYHFGAGRDAANMVYIVIGTGVGAAIIVNGELFRGEHNSAGEIGHVTIDPQGEPCPCGNVGCVETFVAGPRIAHAYMDAQRRSPGPSHPPESAAEVTGADVAQLAAEGDPVALSVMTRAGEALGAAVGSMAMILNIDLYVIGSSVAKAGDLLLEPARRAVPRHTYRSVARGVRIVGCNLPDDGPILGCGWIIRQALAASVTGNGAT